VRYLLITHVPAFVGQSPGVLRISEPWLLDLTAQTNALRSEGFDVTVATPVHEVLDARTLARERIVELPLEAQPFKHIALPAMRQVVKADIHGDALHVANSPFCQRGTPGACCHFLRGMLLGLLGEALGGEPLHVVESRCRNIGADTCCFEFHA
jgi:hypothetical protein